MSRKKLKTELSVLEKTFPRDCDGCFQIVIASPEELVCRFVDQKTKKKFCLQCNISVSEMPSYRSYKRATDQSVLLC